MPEVTVKILWRNKRRGAQFEPLVELFRDGELKDWVPATGIQFFLIV